MIGVGLILALVGFSIWCVVVAGKAQLSSHRWGKEKAQRTEAEVERKRIRENEEAARLHILKTMLVITELMPDYQVVKFIPNRNVNGVQFMLPVKAKKGKEQSFGKEDIIVLIRVDGDTSGFAAKTNVPSTVVWGVDIKAGDLVPYDEQTVLAHIFTSDEALAAYRDQLERDKIEARILAKERRKQMEREVRQDLIMRGEIEPKSHRHN